MISHCLHYCHDCAELCPCELRGDCYRLNRYRKICRCLKCGQTIHCFRNSYSNVIRKTIEFFVKNDRYLLENDLHERTDTHKLAEYLQYFLPQWNVDCEYNKNLNTIKILDFNEIINGIKNILTQKNINYVKQEADKEHNQEDIKEVLFSLRQELEEAEKNQFKDESGALNFLCFNSSQPDKRYIKKVYPDIIAHIRGTTKNKIIIEAKKKSKPDEKARWFDLIKLGLFTRKNGLYRYDVGYFIDLPQNIPENFHIEFRQDKNLKKIMPNSNVFIVDINDKK
ncbi:MAG: hypothetical protein FWG57_02560 [Endomicrobia bacterium]|nr:hypothetical protein [Endomicrobiia bacterium]